MNGLAALAFIVLFSQCAGKADNQVANYSGFRLLLNCQG